MSAAPSRGPSCYTLAPRIAAIVDCLGMKDRERPARREPSARSLLLTVLGEYVLPSGQPAWTGALTSALGLLGVAEKAARQALARTAAEGWIVSSRHGRLARWELTESGTRLLSDGAQRIYSLGRDGQNWDGRWLILLTGGPDAGRERRQQLRTRLTWAGFGALPGGVWICPDPGREAEALHILADLGLAGDCMSFVALYGQVGEPRDVVSRAWNLSALREGYADFIATFAGADPSGDDATLAAQTMLVHQWRRFPFLDPRLPADLLPDGWPGPQAAQVFASRHERWRPGAQRCWAGLVSRPGARCR
jgi:phenylacetic acid degradation operon negative regulatory protein